MSENTRYTPPFEEGPAPTFYTDAEVQEIMDEIRVNNPGITGSELQQRTLRQVKEGRQRHEAVNLAIDLVMPQTYDPESTVQNKQIREKVTYLFTRSNGVFKDAIRDFWPDLTAELENQQK